VHPDPGRLLEQAKMLIETHKDETDLRRAVSAAYYALFHYTLKAAADFVIGSANCSTPRYNLAYRSIDHGVLKDIYRQLSAPTLNDKVKPYAPAGGFAILADFARLTLNLQGERNLADYDLMQRFNVTRAEQAISTASDAIKIFESASVGEHEAFLPLLLFKIRPA
jgi:hypothetical protein